MIFKNLKKIDFYEILQKLHKKKKDISIYNYITNIFITKVLNKYRILFIQIQYTVIRKKKKSIITIAIINSFNYLYIRIYLQFLNYAFKLFLLYIINVIIYILYILKFKSIMRIMYSKYNVYIVSIIIIFYFI